MIIGQYYVPILRLIKPLYIHNGNDTRIEMYVCGTRPTDVFFIDKYKLRYNFS